MFVAVSGTPGCGKSTVLSFLKERGYNVETIEELANKYEAIEGDEVDIELLKERLVIPNTMTFLGGHLSHLLPNEMCIILRCNPNILRERLATRGYSEEKVRQNLEAEAIDLILVEALDGNGKVYEINTTDCLPEKVTEDILNIMSGNDNGYRPGNIDWSEVVLEWY